MTVYRHLSHAIRIIRTERDFHNWKAHIERLTQEEQDEVRPWLREYVKVHGLLATKSIPTPSLSDFSKAKKRR